MLHCWELEHTCRPTFSDLVGSLSQSLESMAGYLDVGAFGHLMEAIENPGVEDHDSAETESRIMDEPDEVKLDVPCVKETCV